RSSWATRSSSSARSPSPRTATPFVSRSSRSVGSLPSASAPTPRRSPTSTASAARSPIRSPSWRWPSSAPLHTTALRVRAQARLLEDRRAEGEERDRQGQAEGAPPPPPLLVPEALGHLGAPRPAARGRRSPGLLGDPEGTL